MASKIVGAVTVISVLLAAAFNLTVLFTNNPMETWTGADWLVVILTAVALLLILLKIISKMILSRHEQSRKSE